MKKLFCVLALLLVLPRAGAVSARAAVVIDADTGEMLFEQMCIRDRLNSAGSSLGGMPPPLSCTAKTAFSPS